MQAEVDKLRNRCRALVINSSYRLAPWADMLYAADRRWWEQNPAALAFAGLKVTSRDHVAKRHGIHNVDVIGEADAQAHRFYLEIPGVVGHGGNSGFQAFNLALQCRPRGAILLGFDYCGEHWHEKHLPPLGNPRPQAMDKWRLRLDVQADLIAHLGIEVVNASTISALEAYPKMSIEAALKHFGI